MNRRRAGKRASRPGAAAHRQGIVQARGAQTPNRVSDDRAHGIGSWWGYIDQVGLDVGDTKNRINGRLRPAFQRVLMAVSDEQWQMFWDLQPQVICLPLSDAKVFAVLRGRVVIYFDPRIFSKTNEWLTRVVAWEVARLMLGHHEDENLPISNEEAASAVGDLVERWGFNGHRPSAYRGLDP
jgi:hypothetical protein